LAHNQRRLNWGERNEKNGYPQSREKLKRKKGTGRTNRKKMCSEGGSVPDLRPRVRGEKKRGEGGESANPQKKAGLVILIPPKIRGRRSNQAFRRNHKTRG